jgi:hypothetical protein
MGEPGVVCNGDQCDCELESPRILVFVAAGSS